MPFIRFRILVQQNGKSRSGFSHVIAVYIALSHMTRVIVQQAAMMSPTAATKILYHVVCLTINA